MEEALLSIIVGLIIVGGAVCWYRLKMIETELIKLNSQAYQIRGLCSNILSKIKL